MRLTNREVPGGRGCLRWLRSHRKTTAFLVLLLLALVLVNFLAWMHAWAMTHFAPAGTKTPRPDSLTFLEKIEVLFTGVTVPRPEAGDRSPAKHGLAFETHRIVGPEVELESWYIPHPHARALVLLFHGYAACKAAVLREAEAFHEMGCATLLVDFRGSGGSSGSETTLGVAEADDVAAAVAYARAQWPNLPLVLYAQSMGSAAVLRAVAVHGVQARALVLECPFDRLVSTVGNRFTKMGLPAFPGAELLVFWGGVQHGFNGFSHNPAAYAAEVRCPTLLFHGTEDPWVRIEEVQAVFEALPVERQMELFEGVAHESYLTRSADRWKPLVKTFLDKHLTRAAP